MRRLALLATFTVLTAVLLTFTVGRKQSSQDCGAYRQDKLLQIASIKIKAEVAKSQSDKQKGLGGRPCIGINQGMLFIFDKPGYYSFWMKDMKFPIDIVWISSDHKVLTKDVDIKPSTYPKTFVNEGKPAKYVLELQANRTRSLDLVIGTPINF